MLLYTGGKDCIFFKSKNVGFGEELFWDFLGWVMWGRCSFSKFCSQLSTTYQTNTNFSAPFVSCKTFVDAFFSWVTAFNIDFRKEVDPWCKYDPPALACDGTHVGVSIRLINNLNPVTKPDLEETHICPHTKLERCFLPCPERGDLSASDHNIRLRCVKEARQFLSECVNHVDAFADIASMPIDQQDVALLEIREEQRVFRESLFAVLGWMGKYTEFITMYLGENAHLTILNAAEKLLKLLLKENHAVSTVLPYRYCTHTLTCCDAMQNNSDNLSDLLVEMQEYSIEVAKLMDAARLHNRSDIVVKFVRELVDFVNGVHSLDRQTAPAVQQPKTYNPPSGTCYYFTEHGDKLRDLPSYSLNEKQSIGCTKSFPLVSYGGYGYIFLFFCPYHGHCYGFHIIDGGEGRKDPFSALLKYKPSPPKELFYDFACGMSEYSLNREPDFFKWVRFWHDIFHGVNHMCLPCFKCRRVLGLLGVNTEICEQFNSYLNSIKYTASHLSQIHFMLFTQFLIYLWNKDKTFKFGEIARVAAAGLE